MKILCPLNQLTVPGVGERKEGLYPTLIRIQKEITPEVSVLAANTRFLSDDQAKIASEAMGGAFIVPVTGSRLRSLFRYFAASKDLSIQKRIHFMRVYRCELSAADKYIASHGRPDVITALQSCEDSGILAYLIGRRHSIPYIILEHRTGYQRGLMREGRAMTLKTVIQSAELLLTVSPQLGASIQKALSIKIPHLKTMPNPIPEDFFTKPTSSYDRVKEFAKGRFIFAGWTNWRDIKRLDIALEAFQKVHAQIPKTCLVIAGPVPDWSRKMADNLGISSSTLFVGSINRKEIKQLSYECDCCILTSDHETFGLPIIEAMTAGKPVVATKCGGPESIIIDGAYGCLVDRSNAEKFARAMLGVVQSYNIFDPSKIQKYCRETYGESALLKKWENIYKELNLYD